MLNLIPVSLLVGALGGILYIASNHLSEFNDEGEKDDVFGLNVKDKIVQYVNQLPLENIKIQSLSFTKKALHRFRVTLLKTDNHLVSLIGKISQRDKTADIKNNENEHTSDFWENLAKSEKQITPPAVETEVKVDFAIKTEAAKKYFDPVRNLTTKEMDIRKPAKVSDGLGIKLTKVSNGVDIQPAKISSEIYEDKPIKIYSDIPEAKRPKKSLKTKKTSK